MSAFAVNAMTQNTLFSWLQSHRLSCDMEVEEIFWKTSQEWFMKDGDLRHKSGGFFSITGVQAEGSRCTCLRQPIINQPETGILGFLARKHEGRMHMLVQAKPEPGNIGLVQAAPSVQATESNYKRLHNGKETPFLGYFLDLDNVVVHSDSLQSEQGTRFLYKYNRNMIVEIPADVVLDEGDAYRWHPADELCASLAEDFQVNTDARSVLATAPWAIFSPEGKPFDRWKGKGGIGEMLLNSYETEENNACSPDRVIAGKLCSIRDAYPFTAKVISLSSFLGDMNDNGHVFSDPHGGFDVRHFRVRTSEREVDAWDQPLVASTGEGEAVLLAKEMNGVLHFLFSCRAEIGFRECFQYGPAIQNTGGVLSVVEGLCRDNDILQSARSRSRVLLSCLHSDEGGRFYQCVSRYSIMLVDDSVEDVATETMSWMNLRQIEKFCKVKGFFSNEARSLISMLLAYV
jgi:dTDP-4-dehydro-6-deoxy-alpha-D-glucopyranose 2,3-dehydratase